LSLHLRSTIIIVHLFYHLRSSFNLCLLHDPHTCHTVTKSDHRPKQRKQQECHKISICFVLTGYNERLPYCCDILEPSYRPTRLPPPDPGNSTQFRGSRTLKQRHKGTDHIRPMSRILFGATGSCCEAVLTDVSRVSTVAMYKERFEILRRHCQSTLR
jgi:hypothetical protein